MTTSAPAASYNDEQLLAVLTAIKAGDFTGRLPTGASGTAGQIAGTVNALMDQLSTFASETNRLTREIGIEGRFGGQAAVPGLSGSWKEMTDNLNRLAGNLTDQVRAIATTTTAVANGDLTKKVEVKAQGEIGELKTTINIMVDQLNSFASELTHVVRDIGTEGKLGGQMEVRGISGTWKDLITNVNLMASNLTAQLRNITAATHAVASGDLSQRVQIEVRGELLELKTLINGMLEKVNLLVSEFNRLAREIGTEGRFGGQAEILGASGAWKELIDNVNDMSANLTAQVRDLSRTAHALVSGDTSRKATVIAAGETVELKDAINQLVDQHSRSSR